MQITLYKNFNKRQNSTKQPANGTQMTVVMKQGCSVENPVFLIDGVDLDYNYCLFNGRYYYINDMKLSKNNIYELSCTVDLLATYKTEIGNYTGYIERASDDYDPYLYDPCIIAKREIIQPVQAETQIPFFDSVGSYIFPCMNRYGIEIFCTQNLADFGELFMPGTYGLTDFTDWLKSGLATLTDLSEKLGKVIWVPFTPSQLDAQTVAAGSPVSIGTISFTLDHDLYKISPLSLKESLGVFQIQKPSGYYGDFRDCSGDWTQYTLYIPGVGTVPLDPVIVGSPDVSLYPYIYFEPENGDFTVRIDAFENYGTQAQSRCRLGVYKGNMSAVVPWGDSQFAIKETGGNIIGGLTGMVGGITSGNYAGAVASAVGGVVGGTVQAFSGANAASMYSYGGGLASAKELKTFVFSQIPLAAADIPSREMGRPLCRVEQIGTHTGFVKMGNANVSIPGFGEEKAALNNILNGGFYYE